MQDQGFTREESRELLQKSVGFSVTDEALSNLQHVMEGWAVGLQLVLRCIALERLGRMDEALKELQQVIKLAEPGAWIWPFVESGRPMAELLECLADQKGVNDYLQLVLDKLSTNEAQSAGAAVAESRSIEGREISIVECLTRRELEILELLTQRLKNKEIAVRLFVSPETVKTHLKHLYRKLDVHNRREAAVKAVEIADKIFGVRVNDIRGQSKNESLKQAQKVAWVLQLIEDLDVIPVQYFKKLVNTDGIWEVRIQVGSNIFRILGFLDGDQLIVLNHAFQKKTQKTPKKEIKLAETRKRNYLDRRRSNE